MVSTSVPGRGQWLEDYTIRAKLNAVVVGSQTIADGSPLSLDTKRMLLTVKTKHGALVLVPAADSQGRISWTFTNGEGLKASQLPPSCRAPPRR